VARSLFTTRRLRLIHPPRRVSHPPGAV